jgi:hypothetical protein
MISGLLATLAFYVFENAEARMQVAAPTPRTSSLSYSPLSSLASSTRKRSSSSSPSLSKYPTNSVPSSASPFHSMTSTFRYIFKTEGTKGLFRGVTPTTLGG